MTPSLDLGCSLGLVALLVLVIAAWGVRVATRGAERYERVRRDQGSALLGAGAMHMGYWAMQPLGAACVRLGLTANAVSWLSLAIGAGAGAALALGHFGLGAALSASAGICDALDGMVARLTGSASDAGEVLDAAIDRWVEFLFLAGVAVCYRSNVLGLALALFAIQGSFMVSYATAKAEALQVAAPRGAMRKGERTVYLLAGAGLGPIVGAAAARLAWPAWLSDVPMQLALALVAVVANVSAILRLARVAEQIRVRQPATPATPRRALFATLGRHQVGAALATLVDFGTMTLLVSGLGVGAVPATAAGAGCGALTNFTLGRRWIFQSTDAPPLPQAGRYALVSASSLALNALGEYALHDRLGLQYFLARVIVASVVSVLFNFPMQRHFVFRAARQAS